MAVSFGAGPHFAWVEVNGSQFPLEHGSVDQSSQRQSSRFSGALPMNLPGAYDLFATLSENKTSIIVSTRGITEPLIMGEILTVEHDLIPGIIRFAGHDVSDKLHRTKSSEKWSNKTGTQIAQELAGRAGLGFSSEVSSGLMAGKKSHKDYVKLTDGISLAAVIHKLSEFDGARWWVDAKGTMHYIPIGSSSGVYTLNYSRSQPTVADFMKLSVHRNIPAGKDIKVTVKSWHPKSKKAFSDTSNVSGSGGSSEWVYHIPNLMQEHTKQHAKSKAQEAASHELKIVADVVGDPTINPAMALMLSGTGEFDQSYQIEHIHHEIGMSGHRMTINAKSAKSGRSAS